MTYLSGSLIQATDYNGFVSTNADANLNATWGTATSSAGYGQTALGTVSTGGSVTAAQWASLNNTITSAANHQGTSITSRTSPVAGNTISILSALSTDLGSLYTNRYNASASGTQYTAWTGTSSKTAATGSTNAAWTITWTHTVTWASAASCFAFWNAGGLVKIQYSKTGGSTGGDTNWNSFITNVVGTIYLSSTAASKTIGGTSYTGTTKSGGTGTPTTLSTGTGFYQLVTTDTSLYQQYDSVYPYSTSYVLTTAKVDSTTSPTILTLTTTWYQPAWWPGSNVSISGGTATSGITFGTAPTTVVTYLPPESTYLTNSWGTPTVVASVV